MRSRRSAKQRRRNPPRAGGWGAAAPQRLPPRAGELGAALAVLILAGVIAYGNTLSNPLIFDDRVSITENPSIRELARLDRVLGPVERLDYYRPTLNLSLAVCYAFGGDGVVAYHVVNLLIHIAAALTLFGLVRRTLLLPALRERFGDVSTWLALAVGLLWMLHPLQTESVTYVVQRCEAMYGLFSLLAIYGTLRGATSPNRRSWYILAVVASALGMGSKEASAVIPGLVLLYDRIFLADSLRSAFRARWGLYLGLASTWLVLVPMVLHADLAQDPRTLHTVSIWQYARTQFGVVVHYLRLAFWPVDLCLDYGWPVAESAWQFLPAAAVIAALLAATVWALFACPRWGFLGVFFFATLAPSSSIIPIPDLAFEHRMYLPLAAPAAAVVLGVHLLLQRLRPPRLLRTAAGRAAGLFLFGSLAFVLGTLTFQRNRDYGSELRIWRDTVSKAPKNPRAHYNLGYALTRGGDLSRAVACYRRALALDPEYAKAHNGLGEALVRRGNPDRASEHFQRALEIDPKYAATYNNYGHLLLERGQVERAIELFQRALEIQPAYANAHNNLGRARLQQGQLDRAVRHFQAAVEGAPDNAQFHHNLSHALARSGQLQAAIQQGRQAVQLRSVTPGQQHPDYASSLNNLGLMYRDAGDPARAERLCRRAVEIWEAAVGPGHPDCLAGWKNLALIEQSLGRWERSGEACRRVLAVAAGDPQAHYLLGIALQRQGDDRGAVRHWQQALAGWPDQAELLVQLAWTMATSPDDAVRDGPQAVQLAQRAVQAAGAATAGLLDVQAAAWAEAGQFDRAVETARDALQKARVQNNPTLADALRARLDLYRTRTPFRDPGTR